MAFLCLAQQLQISRCSEEARKLINEAMAYGVQRQQACRWREAAIFFGRAYEALKIRLLCQSPWEQTPFSTKELIDAHYALCRSLHQLDEPKLRKYRLELPYVLQLIALHHQVRDYSAYASPGQPFRAEDACRGLNGSAVSGQKEKCSSTDPELAAPATERLPGVYRSRQLARLKGLEAMAGVFIEKSGHLDADRVAGF